MHTMVQLGVEMPSLCSPLNTGLYSSAQYNSMILKMPTAIVKSQRHIHTTMDDLS